MASTNRWAKDDENPGSLFHELVVLPTLCPEIARPEYMHGPPTGPVIYPQPRSQQCANGVIVTGVPSYRNGVQSISNGSPVLPVATLAHDDNHAVDDGDGQAPDRVFHLNVTLERTEQSFTPRGPGKPKIVPVNKCGPKLPLLRLSRSEVASSVFEVHGLQDRYLPGPISGPPFKVSYKGFAGGQKRSPTIRGDEDWTNFIAQLAGTKAIVDAVQITIAIKDLEPYKNHKRGLSPDPSEEATYGTHVPNVASYSNTQRMVAMKINEIKAAWSCNAHGHCFIDGDSEHVQMNRFRLNSWATAMIAGGHTATDPPPDELLREWKGLSRHAHLPTLKRRGLQGPHSATTPAATDSGGDLTAILTSIATPFVKSLASMAMSTLTPPFQVAPPPTSSSDRLSSPPPAIEDELAACLKGFGSARGLSQETVDKAVDALEEVAYTPDIMGEVTAQRLQDIIGFAEGHAIALRKFAREWCGKVDAKRARYL